MNIQEMLGSSNLIGLGSKGDAVAAVQRALLVAGHSLVLDAKYGTITESAVRRYQAAHHLAVVGYVGPKTAALLDKELVTGNLRLVDEANTSEGSVLKAAPWLAQMRAITGTKEIPGKANSPIIMSWIGDIAKAFPDLAEYAATYTGDEIPWCGFGLAGCMARAHIHPPEGFMFALNWSKWGKRLDKPIPGCVMTFKRTGGGHVSLLEKLDRDHAYIRGCNQSDMVNVTRKSMDTFVAATWPTIWPLPNFQIAGDISNHVASASEA